MSSCCHPATTPPPPRYRRVLWIALVVNAAMFAVELAAGWGAQSVALLADAADFLGDAANYGLSLFALGMGVAARSRAALFKGGCMGAYGRDVLGHASWNALHGASPEPLTMGLVGALALVANVAVAALLYAYRQGDADMRSVWLCSRNDALGNLAILIAAAGVFGSGSAWPDLAVAAIMGGLAISAAGTVIRQARAERERQRKASRHAHP